MASPTEQKSGHQRICLVCQKETSLLPIPITSNQETTKKEAQLPQERIFFFGSNDHSGLNIQLWNIFIARKLLNLTQDQCANFFRFVKDKETESQYPHPSEWFVFCKDCSAILEKAWKVYKAILRLDKELDQVAKELRTKIIQNCLTLNAANDNELDLNTGSIECQIWNTLMTSTEGYRVKQEMPTSEQNDDTTILNKDPFFNNHPNDYQEAFPQPSKSTETGPSDENVKYETGINRVNVEDGIGTSSATEVTEPSVIKAPRFNSDETSINENGNKDKNEKPIGKQCTQDQCNSKSNSCAKMRKRKEPANVTPNVCEICSKKYSTAYSLRLHQEISHSNGKYAVHCEACDKSFLHGHYLKIHYRSCKKFREGGYTKSKTSKIEVRPPSGTINKSERKAKVLKSTRQRKAGTLAETTVQEYRGNTNGQQHCRWHVPIQAPTTASYNPQFILPDVHSDFHKIEFPTSSDYNNAFSQQPIEVSHSVSPSTLESSVYYK